MVPAAPRLDIRVQAAIADLDRDDRSIAEINRISGSLADHLGVPRPSYEQVRVVVHAARNGRRVYGWGEFFVDAVFQPSLAYAHWERVGQPHAGSGSR